MPLSNLMQIGLSACLDSPAIIELAARATEKAVTIVKNHFTLSAYEISEAYQHSYVLALTALSVGLAAPTPKLKFLQKLAHSKLEREFSDQVEQKYLQPFVAEQELTPASVSQLRQAIIKTCHTLITYKTQLFAAPQTELTDDDLVAVLNYQGSFALTQLLLNEIQALQPLEEKVATWLAYHGLLGNAVLFFFLEQLRIDPRVKDTFMALQGAGLWVEVREIKTAQAQLTAVLTQQQQQIFAQLTQQRLLLQQTLENNDFTQSVPLLQHLSELQQQAQAQQELLTQVPQLVEQAQRAWQLSYQEMTQFYHDFQTWTAWLEVKLEQVSTDLDSLVEIVPVVMNIEEKVSQILHQIKLLGRSPQLALAPPPPKFICYETVLVNNQGNRIETIKHQAQFQVENLDHGITLDLVLVPRGSFLMGSPDTEAQRKNTEGPLHRVTLTEFWMSQYPITQAQWQAVMGEHNPSGFKGPPRPVENLTWQEAVTFCQKLAQITGRPYRLPSEAQWEYACRAGTTTPFYFGDTITTDLVNYDGIYTYGQAPTGVNREQTTAVNLFPPNAFGLYDLHGNVWEWCADVWHNHYQGPATDGRAWETGPDTTIRSIRGGAWFFNPGNCRCAARHGIRVNNRGSNIGFRVVV